MPSSSSQYYDIDAILAEEELVPCTTNFDFSYLGHLDPDNNHALQCYGNNSGGGKHYLPEGSRIKLPLWALDKWASLDFVHLGLPRHYQRKARERLEAAPSEVNLRKRNERYFLAGRFLVDLIESSVQKISKSAPSSRREKLEHIALEAKKLRNTLLMTYTGERLRQTLDWSLSSVGDDVTVYTCQLSEMERRLFQCGAVAATAHLRWRVYGKRRWLIQHHMAAATTTTTTSSSSGKRPARPVTPETSNSDDDNNETATEHNRYNKRQRYQAS